MSRTSKGLTLVELLICVLLISLMLIATSAIYHTGYNVFYNQFSRQNIKDQTSYAFLMMTNELHQALSVTAATTASITFTTDLNNDGVNETIQYTWSGTSGQPLNRVVGTQTTQMVRSVSSLSFTYYGTNNTQLSFPIVDLTQVKLVAIDLTTTSGSESFHLRTRIQLRCI